MWLVLAACAAAATAIYLGLSAGGTTAGVAEVVEYKVSSTETARVVGVPASPGQAVRKGDVVAVLDSDVLSQEFEVLSAEVSLREADLRARVAFLGRSRKSEERSFAAAVDQADIALLQARVVQEQDRAELEGVRARIKWWQAQVEAKVASSEALEDLKVRAATLERRVALDARTVAARAADLDLARRRLDSWREAGADPAGPGEEDVEVGPVRRAIEVARSRLSLLQARREALTLRAPRDGVVFRVLLHPGDVVTPGSPVVVIRSARPERVLAYVTDALASRVSVGARATVSLRDGSGRTIAGRVASLAGGMTPLPGQLQTVLNPGAWGREVVIDLVEAAGALAPGQVVSVAFGGGGDGTATIARASEVVSDAASATGPAPMTVPDALRGRTRFEPSGIVWIPEREKFLVVSDDTGLPDRDDHAPWLFWMDRKGVVDPAPAVVAGVAEFNDLESIVRRPDGVIFALASQSVSRKGRRPAGRTQVVRLRVAGDRIEATGSASLAGAIEARGDRSYLEGLGLGAPDPLFRHDGQAFDRLLEIEGMTTDGDDLLLGLKQPLDAEGRALVWRLSRPDRLVETGRLDEGSLAVFARVALTVGDGPAAAPAGVSDLVRLPDGGLGILAVNPACRGGDPATGGGALWVVPPPVTSGGVLKARRVRDFPGLKPEGAAVGPGAAGLMVVFDPDQDVPLFMEIPLPL